MDPVNPLNQLVQALRQQLASQSERSRRTQKQSHEGSAKSTLSRAASKPDLDQVKTEIRERIKKLSPNQRESEQAAQVFIESILVWEFGEELLQDPRFQDMSREVQNTMKRDPETWKRLKSLMHNL